MPSEITVYEFELEKWDDEEPEIIEVREITKIKKKRIHTRLFVGDKKLEDYYEPCEYYPIVNFPFLDLNDPNKLYGIIHFILDVSKAMNKYLSMILYDIATNGYRKGFIWDSTVIEPNIEQKWSEPNALIRLRPDPTLSDGGKPFFLEPSTINQSIQYMLDYFKQLIEYITGIFGVVQGDTSNAPETMGATQSLQNFGTQRVKLYTRQMELSMERLALVVAQYIQAFTPRDKVIKYYDDNGDAKEVQALDSRDDIKLKVRVEMVSQLPTTKQIFGQMLGFIAQTAGDPSLTSLLTEYMLKIIDAPEAKEISEKLDVVNKLNQQVQQLQAQADEVTKENNILKNNLMQKDIAAQTQQAVAGAEKNIAVAEAKAMPEEGGGEQMEEPEPEPEPEEL